MTTMPEVAEKTDRAFYGPDLERMKALGGPAWLDTVRQNGAARFSELDLPHRKQEAWRLTNVAPILRTPFQPLVSAPARTVDRGDAAPYLYDEAEWTQLVFVDGFFAPSLSRIAQGPEGLRVGGLADAIARDDEVVRHHLGHFVDPSNAFIALNAAFVQDGAFFYLPKNEVLEAPIHFLYLSTGKDTVACHPRNLLVLGASSQATVVETHVGLSEEGTYLSNGVTEIVLEDNARLERHKIVDEGAAAFHLATTAVCQGRDTFLRSFTVTLGGKIVRNELRVLLNGKGAECSLSGLYLNDGNRLIDNALHVEHAKAHCRSRMAYKGVLDGKSNSVFTGKVLVNRGSQKTDSDQLNNNLLLSADATIDTKPQLEIFADDVKCTHGATVGSFPKELIFYFQSRGISPGAAHGLLTYGFADEIVKAITLGPLRDRLERHVFNKYSSVRPAEKG